jgi:hypothetical protein
LKFLHGSSKNILNELKKVQVKGKGKGKVQVKGKGKVQVKGKGKEQVQIFIVLNNV